MDNSLEQIIEQYKRKINSAASYNNIFMQLLQNENYQSWIILQQCLKHLQGINSLAQKKILNTLSDNIGRICAFSTFMLIYKLKEKKNFYVSYTVWERTYKQVFIGENNLLLFNSWIKQYSKQKVTQETLDLVISYFPIFFKKQLFVLTQVEIQSIVYWLSYSYALPIQSPQSMLQLCNLISQNNRFKSQAIAPRLSILQYETPLGKQDIMLKKVIDILAETQNTTGYVIFLLHPKRINQTHIYYLLDENQQQNNICLTFTEEQLFNVFIGLTKAGITNEGLSIIEYFSRVLRNLEQFSKLRFLYEKHILPILARRGKHFDEKKSQKVIHSIVDFYTFGLLRHCDIGQEGVKCLTQGISKLNDQDLKKKWIDLCFMYITQRQQYRKQVIQDFRKQNVFNSNMIQINYKEYDVVLAKRIEDIWDVTHRAGRKHKIYQKSVTNEFRGFRNEYNHCYIISVVQALYMSSLNITDSKIPIGLQKFFIDNRIIIKQEKQTQLLDEIRKLFLQLSGQMSKGKNIVVNYLKNLGPQQFKISEHEQDVQDYLLRLFECIQNSLSRKPKLLKQFQNIYQIKMKSIISCPDCGKKSEQIQTKEYMLSISVHEHVKKQFTQQILDYSCENCKKTNCIMTKTFELDCDVFIVHINRFKVEKNYTKKLLSCQSIPRHFQNYHLSGFICHRGKNVQCGHYMYYAKVGKLTWVQFNDWKVKTFKLDQQDEQFEKEMKSELTPYILFYTRRA